MTGWRYQAWDLARGQARGDAYDEDVAQARYAARQDVVVLVGDDADRPGQVMRLSRGGKDVQVTWLDDLRRPVLGHTYSVQVHAGWPPDVLLLEKVHLRRYDDAPPGSRLSAYEESTLVDPGGSFGTHRWTRATARGGTTVGLISPDQLPVEPVPAFGQWEPLLAPRPVPTADPPQDLGVGIVRDLRARHPDDPPRTGPGIALSTADRRVEGHSSDQDEVMVMRDVQLAALPLPEALAHLDALVAHPAGSVITAAPANLHHLVRTALDSRRILYVPLQQQPVPEPVLERAFALDITIRQIP